MGRGFAIGVAALALAGSAAAAVVGLTAEPSKPLAGPVNPAAPSARSYAVSLLPDLRAGQAGWCGLLRLGSGDRITSAGLGCTSVRAAGGAQIIGGGTYGRRESIDYAVVTARTRRVRFDERTLVATRSDPRLPYGWRFAVAVIPTRGLAGPLATGIMPAPARGPGATTTSTPSTPSKPPREPEPFIPVQYDAHGNVLPATVRADDRSRSGRSRVVTAAHPARRCVIGGAAGYVAGYARVAVSRPQPPPRIEGRAFASCANTIFHTNRTRGGLNVAILLDAHHPRAGADALPRTPGLSGRRLGPGWIVVSGGSAADRQKLLDRLHPRL
jgi:hypothetical protein